LSGNIDSAKSELNNNIAGAKDELNGNINTAKNELNGNIDSAKSELNSNIDNAAANANAYTDAAEAAAKGYTDSAASELDGKIGETASELDGKITDANGRIDETNGKVNDLGDGLEVANGRIDGVDQDLQDSKTNITNEIQRVTNSVSEVDKLRLAAEAALQGSIDELEFDLTGLRQIVVGVTAYIKSGLIYTTDAGIPVYGIEIGQEVESDGTKVFNKFARFTSEKLSFYDAAANEVAYISDTKLYIGQAEITISFKVGGLKDLVLANGDVVTKWEGGS
jgi:predicted  nucleic acid-binding Zn-ribbon protein